MNGLVFDYGWRKPININFNGQSVEIELVFDAYEGEEVTDKQKKAYEDFSANQASYEKEIVTLITHYVRDNQIQNAKVEAKSLLFNQDGAFALLCECSWDIEDGIAVVLSPKKEVTRQDNFI